ncbi:MAG TPA: DUF5979 domain-containing protein, partial [Actinomycetaceae bacterium]|nr:DUF5979 domain-containing protein [Actinomycetaceae bacterium]
MAVAPRHQRTRESQLTRTARRRTPAILASLALLTSMGFTIPAAFADGVPSDPAGTPSEQTAALGGEQSDEVASTQLESPAPGEDEGKTEDPGSEQNPGGAGDEVPPAGGSNPDGADVSDGTGGEEAGGNSAGGSGDSSATEGAKELDASSDGLDGTMAPQGEIMPFGVGDVDGVTAPYVYWTVKDDHGNLVGGAEFEIQGPRSGSGWGSANRATVADCVAAPCGGPDLDPDPGEFAVQQMGNHRISDSHRYRIRFTEAPDTYELISPSGWQEIPARSGNNNQHLPANGAWVNRTFDFGNFEVVKLQTQPICTAGYVYGITNAGQIRQVAPNGTVTNLGDTPQSGSDFNGLGIGYGGEPVFAYAREGTGNTDSDVSIYKYDPAAGTWTDTGHNVNSGAAGGTTVTFVAGAVNLDTGKYFLGGYTSAFDGSDRVFRLWEYDPTSNTSVYKGAISTPTGLFGAAANGDMAFDADGNLFVVRGSGSTTTVYSVTAANLAAANGGTIPSAASNTVSNTTSSVNGVAFDADGYGFLSSSNDVQRYIMPGWTGKADVTSSLGVSGNTSTDLASCGSPPTITIEKNVQGGRVNDSDQFTITLSEGSTVIGAATTTGNATGVQDQRVGPLPTVRNVELTLKETAAGSTNLDDYMTSYRCLVDGVQVSQGRDTRTGTVTIPSGGQETLCQFFNSPLIASVTVSKQVTDGAGGNAAPREGWAVGATVTPSAGSTVTTNPTATSQETGTAGSASWQLSFGDDTHSAAVTVSESQETGYEFLSGECTVTHLDGITETTPLASEAGTELAGIVPGDQVDCTYVNRPTPGTLAIKKAFDGTVPSGSGDIEFSGTYECTLGAATVATGTWTRTGAGEAELTADPGMPAPDAIPSGAECSATETPPTGSDGLPNTSYEWGTPTVSPESVTITSEETGTITVTNTSTRVLGGFSVTKDVVGTADEGITYTGAWECALGDETVDGTWSVGAGGTWSSPADADIPLGSICTVTSEARPDSPVADDPSWAWDGDADLGDAVTVGSDDTTITVTNTSTRLLGGFSVTKDVVGTADATNVYSGGWECVDSAGVTASGTWSVTGEGTWASSDNIPQGSTCTVKSETRPDSPVAGDSSYQWDGDANLGTSITVGSDDTTITVTNTSARLLGGFSVTKVVEGTADATNVYSGDWECVDPAGATMDGDWSVTGEGTWASSDNIPLGSICSVKSETRPDSPVADDPSWAWDGDANLGSSITVGSDDTTITVTNTSARLLGGFSVTKDVEGTADATNVYSGGWECVDPAGATISGDWSVTGEDTWTSPDTANIPLGSICTVTSEARPDSPVADDLSWAWDG